MSSKKSKSAGQGKPEITIDADTAPSHTEFDTTALEKAAEEDTADVPESDPGLPEEISPNAGGTYRLENGVRVRT